MFHLKVLTKSTHADLAAIQAEVASNPNRHYTAELKSYNFSVDTIKQLLQIKCGVIIQFDDNFSKDKIEKLITIGNEIVVMLSKDFSEVDLLNYLEKGASVVVCRDDGFDVFQIKKLVEKGKEKTFVLGGQLLENHFKDYLTTGGSVLLRKDDLSPFAITRLLPHGENRINIQGAGFSNFRINKFLDGKAIVTLGAGNQLSQPRIEEKVKDYKNQIHLESEHFKFDIPWIKKMENLGAIIV